MSPVFFETVMATVRTFEDILADPRPGEPVYRIAENYPRQGDWTYEEYCRFEESYEGRVELVNGCLEFLAVPKRVHQDILASLFVLLYQFVMDRSLGHVRPSGNRLRLESRSIREPDIVFVSREKVAAHDRHEDFRDADLVVEIVSPDDKSVERDYVEKRADYAAARIPEYWIVDPQEELLTILALDDDATEYREAFRGGPGTTGRSVLLDGLAVDVTALFAEPG